MNITIDLRMICCSGIGTYLSNLVPLIISACAETRFTLIGDARELCNYRWAQRKNVIVVDCTVPIYSIAEQYVIPRLIPKDTSLLWAPHYNIPLCYHGKLLVTVYDAFHLAMPEFVGGAHRRFYAKIMFSAVCAKANAILTISNFSKQELDRLTCCENEKIFPIHLGIADSWFSKVMNNNLHGKPYLLYVGNVKPHKNLSGLIEAFSLLLGDVPHDLVIIGKKEGFITGDDSVLSKAKKLGNRLHFTGYVSDELLMQYVSHADILVLPSFYEGFGLPPLEAMATGCPVIVSNKASLPEVCGEAAIYCDPYDINDIMAKIELVLNDNVLRKRMQKCGLAHAKSFTWEKCATETLSVIKMVLNQ